MSGQRIVIVGATGMIGGLAVQEALAHPEVGEVTAVGRRATGIDHHKLREIRHEDFTDCSSLEDRLAGQGVALFCLGAYTGTLPDDAFRRVTVDATVAFARALHAASPGAAFCFLSGAGADPTERSPLAFARYKGAAETALLAMGFGRTHIFRPGYIYPVTPREEPNLSYRIMRVLYPVARRLYPNVGIRSDHLATAMLEAGLHGTPGHASPVLENREIRALMAAHVRSGD